MVGPVEDKEEENFFCGPPGKLNHDQSILTLVGEEMGVGYSSWDKLKRLLQEEI